MRNPVKFGLTALIVALLLSAAISSASARNLSTSSQSIRVTWSRIEIEAGIGSPVQCQLTLEGSFHSRTIAKVLRTLVGVITRATIKTESCTNGRGTVATNTWHFLYEGFTGTLPEIGGIIFVLREYRFTLERPAGLSPTCTYGATTDSIAGTVNLAAGTHVANSVTPRAGNRSTLVEARNEEFFGRCPASSELISTSRQPTVLGGTTLVTAALI